MLDFFADTARFIAASSVISTAINWRNEDFSWKSILHNAAAGMINYPIFYYSKAMSLVLAEAAFPLVYGSGPSAWRLHAYMEHNQNRAQFTEYALDFAPYIFLPIGLKITTELVKYAERKGIQLFHHYFQQEDGNQPVLFSQEARAPRQRSSRSSNGQKQASASKPKRQ